MRFLLAYSRNPQKIALNKRFDPLIKYLA